MAFGFAGAATGASKSLEEIVAQRILAEKLQAEISNRQQQTELERAALSQRATEHADQVRGQQRDDERMDAERRDRNNVRGLEQMRTDRAGMDLDAAISGLPEHAKPLGGLMKAGVIGKLSPEDLRDPAVVAAEAQAKKDAEYNEWKRRQDYNEQQIRTRPKTDAGPKPPGKLPVSMATSIAAAQTSLAGLDRLEKLYSDDKVGPVAGRYNKIERGAPEVIGGLMPDAPKDFEEFAAESATLKNQVIQAITGAAVGVKEQERIMAQIPDVTNTPANWKARAKATRRNLQALMEHQTQMGTGASEAAPGAAVDSAPVEIEYQRDPKTGKLVRVGG